LESIFSERNGGSSSRRTTNATPPRARGGKKDAQKVLGPLANSTEVEKGTSKKQCEIAGTKKGKCEGGGIERSGTSEKERGEKGNETKVVPGLRTFEQSSR